ncbi:MAG: hypothetical protein B7Z30_14895 [Rhizobiales bacterium 12-68-15]|nr:MAG: hypothetical protein B7Z30_14895 [Rhizobiales bacterium 12-68-15]
MAVTASVCRLYGLTIESPFPLPGSVAVAHPGEAPDVTIHWEPESAWRIASLALTEPDAEGLRPRVGETAEGALCVEWRREVQFVFPPENDRIIVVCSRSQLTYVPAAVIGVGMGLLLHRRGLLCLHGAALHIHGRTIALLGESGAGKSTTSAALITPSGRERCGQVHHLRRPHHPWRHPAVRRPRGAAAAGWRVRRGAG